MSGKDLINELLPSFGARVATSATLVATPALWAVPHLFSPLWPKSTQLEILLAQASLALLTLVVGLFVTLAFVVLHQRAVSKEVSSLRAELEAKSVPASVPANPPSPSKSTTRRQSRDHSVRLAAPVESVLVYVTRSPGLTSSEVAKGINCGEPLALHHLEQLLAVSYVKDSHIPGSEWTGAPYRHEWSCNTDGRTYQAIHGLLS